MFSVLNQIVYILLIDIYKMDKNSSLFPVRQELEHIAPFNVLCICL